MEKDIIRSEVLAIEETLRQTGKLGLFGTWIVATEIWEMIRKGQSDFHIAAKIFNYGYGSSMVESQELAKAIRGVYNTLQKRKHSHKDPKLPF